MGIIGENLSSGVCEQHRGKQPAHRRSLISAFFSQFSEYFICKLATGEISIFLKVSVAEETGLNLDLTETEDRFSCEEAHIRSV